MKCSVLTKVVQNDQVLYQWDTIINSVHSFIYARTLFLTFAVLYQIASTKLLKDLKVCKGCFFYMDINFLCFIRNLQYFAWWFPLS